ncbi:hypothetical protein FO519_008105 [Halicephalobus sp. NKZ332]|nr:hypothetical protein FO519_008105 [Halicephalobus sp. NKZ332]
MTDFHYDADYNVQGEPSEMCHRNASDAHPKNIGYYGDYKCDSPKLLIKHALTNAQIILPNPELILWTGDNVPHINNYDNDYTVSAINTTTNMINSFFNNTVVLPVFGNHDYAPANNFPDDSSIVYFKVFNLWKHWIGESQRRTFIKAGYYVYKYSSNVTFLMLNTNLYYRFNTANFTDKTDPGGQFAFMETVLSEAERNNAIVHVVSHIAPGVFERSPSFTWMPNEYNKRFLNITVRYSKTIKWMIFGHHHTDTFHIVKDKSGDPVQVMLMAPAVTPWFSDLDGAGSNNPSFRIIEYDEKTWDYVDIKTYYVDLDKLNNNTATNWSLEYSMKDDYNLDSITPASMNSLLQKMKTDDDLFKKYINYNTVQWKPIMPEGKYRSAQLCSIEFPDLDEYNNCMPSDSNMNEIILSFLSFSVFILLV